MTVAGACSALGCRSRCVEACPPLQYSRAWILHLEIMRQVAEGRMQGQKSIVFCLGDIVKRMSIQLYFKVPLLLPVLLREPRI